MNTKAIWLKLALEEAIDRGILDAQFFGPMLNAAKEFVSFEQSLKLFMARIDDLRQVY